MCNQPHQVLFARKSKCNAFEVKGIRSCTAQRVVLMITLGSACPRSVCTCDTEFLLHGMQCIRIRCAIYLHSASVESYILGNPLGVPCSHPTNNPIRGQVLPSRNLAHGPSKPVRCKNDQSVVKPAIQPANQSSWHSAIQSSWHCQSSHQKHLKNCTCDWTNTS